MVTKVVFVLMVLAICGALAKPSETVDFFQNVAKEYQTPLLVASKNLIDTVNEAATAINKDTSGLQESIFKFTEHILKEIEATLENANADHKSKNINTH